MNEKFLAYLEERGVVPVVHDWMKEVRLSGVALLERTPMPGSRDENWRFTDLAPFDFLELKVEPREESRLVGLSSGEEKVLEGIIAGCDGIPLVFVNGVFVPQMSGGDAGMAIRDLNGLGKSLVQGLMQELPFDERDPFFQLNGAMLQRGVFVEFFEGFRSPLPVHVIYFYTGAFDSGISSPRNYLLFKKGFHGAVLETTVACGDFQFTDNRVQYILLEEGADVEHVHRSHAGGRQFFMNHTGILLRDGAALKTVAVNSGGGILRNNLVIGLAGPDSEVFSGGFFGVVGGEQVDNYTAIEHRASGSKSRQLYKGLLSGTSKGVFRGRVKVARNIEKVEASQLNKNILIGESARVHTMPWLEIDSNDIKCTHGATTGALSEEELFYLASRGISPDVSQKMLLTAFADDVLMLIENHRLRSVTRAYVTQIIENVMGLRRSCRGKT